MDRLTTERVTAIRKHVQQFPLSPYTERPIEEFERTLKGVDIIEPPPSSVSWIATVTLGMLIVAIIWFAFF